MTSPVRMPGPPGPGRAGRPGRDARAARAGMRGPPGPGRAGRDARAARAGTRGPGRGLPARDTPAPRLTGPDRRRVCPGFAVGRLHSVLKMTRTVTVGLDFALRPPRGCAECGEPDLVTVTDADRLNFLCRSCGRCWHAELGWVSRVDPRSCLRCAHRRDCLAALVAAE